MNKERAVTRYLRTHPQANKAIKMLMLWDENKTLSENAIKLGITIERASHFKKLNNLKVKKVRGWLKGPKPHHFRVQANVFRVSRQCVSECILRKN